jgi:predicted DCC family thiol-disulfide oxidoreductase YuxK
MQNHTVNIHIPEILYEKSKLHPIIIYDGECILCNRFVQFILKRDKSKQFRFTPLQDVEKKDSYDTVYLLKNGTIYTHSNAAIRILSMMGFPWNGFRIFAFLPTFIRDGIYRFISANRYRWFGKKDSCFVPSEMGDRFLK